MMNPLWQKIVIAKRRLCEAQPKQAREESIIVVDT